MGRKQRADVDDESQNEAWSRSILLGTHPLLRYGRRFLGRVPSEPRCKLCASPFHGAGGQVMRLFGKAPWPKNPKYCSACFKQLGAHRGGAEIECSLLFADVRGSTALAEQMRPTEFRALMDGFFETAVHVLVEHDAIVDKFVGDEVIGIFIPGMAGARHAQQAIAAAQALLSGVRADAEHPGLPVGAGVNTGVAFVGTVGDADHIELTAMGDPVNVTARLASAAGAGEVLVTMAAAEAAGLRHAGLEHRQLVLRGKSEPTEVVVLGPSS